MTLSGNVYSTKAFEFNGATALSNHLNISSLTSNSAPNYTPLRLALNPPPTGFDPTGRVERVWRKWSGTNLVGVQEVAFGPTYLTNGNQLSIRLRAVPTNSTYYTVGGVWNWPQTYLTSLGATFVPQGVSFRAGAGDQAWVAGYEGNLARMVKDNGTSCTSVSVPIHCSL